MNRRTFIAQAGAALGGAAVASVVPAWAQTASDVKLEIAPLALEIAPGKVIHTVAYNGQVPGPLIRWPEGKPIAIDVFNRTRSPKSSTGTAFGRPPRWMARRRKAAR